MRSPFEFSDFYAFERPRPGLENARTDFTPLGRVNRGEAPRCPRCGGFCGMLPWLPPFLAELEALGQYLTDIACGPGDELLFSERFVRLYNAHRLHGLEPFRPVEIVTVHPRSLAEGTVPRYFVSRPLPSRTS